REHHLWARTLELKLRYSDFTTITRARSLDEPTQLDNEIYAGVRQLFRENWKQGRTIRLLGVGTSNFSAASGPGQMDLLDGRSQHQRWEQALGAADKLRDKFGEGSVTLASGLKRLIREKTHENPPDLHGKRRTEP